ncbi:hypothetical protein PMAYCL1PPCAC_14888, partial [Pristionchus mayeri]
TAACMTCAGGLIMVTADGMGSHPMDMDTLGMDAAGCRTRTFTCLGMNANIEKFQINNGQGVITDPEDGAVDMRALMTVTCNAAGDAWLYMGVSITQVDGAGVIQDGDDGAVDMTAMLSVTCNAAGTAWEFMGAPITQVECASVVPIADCRSCAGNLIMITMAGTGAKPMDGDMLGMDANGCATRTFTCLGTGANIDINMGVGVISDGGDGVIDMMASFTVTCNAAGDAWEFGGVPITQLEC